MNKSDRKRWLPAAALLGALYFLTGTAFGAFADWQRRSACFPSVNVGNVASRGLRRSWEAKTITLPAYVARATQQVIAGEPRLLGSQVQR